METPHAPTPEAVIEGKGAIQRLCWAPGELPVVEYLHRNEVLFAEQEWEFTREAEGAYVFGTHQAASEFAEELTSRGMKCYPLVVAPAPNKIAAERRRTDSLLTTLNSLPDDLRERHQGMMKRNHLD